MSISIKKIPINFAVRLVCRFLLASIFISFCSSASAQSPDSNIVYTQFWNEFCFTHGLKNSKFATELNIGQTWTSTKDNGSMFATNSQYYFRGWAHYHHSARWKFSYFLAYYYNKNVPEINQKKAPELRNAFQAQYFFKKIPYTLNARIRIEDRKIRNADNTLEATYRLRLQMRCIFPLNSKFIQGGTYYLIGANELMVKTYSYLVGGQFIDRNRFTIGGGYALDDDLQLEITYVNDFLPRSGYDELVNVLQINVVFNNLLTRIKKRIEKKHPVEPISSN